jgi:uncharacterized protein (TIGR00245 family)
MQIGSERQLLISALRSTVQLFLIGLVLKVLFDHAHPVWVALLAAVMLTVAGREVMVRQRRRFVGWWGFGVGTLSMFVSSFAVTVLALVVVIGTDPWYAPQYAIPLLGMILGNTMNGISLGLDRLTQDAAQRRLVIETRLALGHDWRRAISDSRREAIRVGLIPIINAMSAAGIVSLPGHDDRPDSGRHAAGRSRQIPDPGHVPDRRRHGLRHHGGGQLCRPPSFRRAPAPATRPAEQARELTVQRQCGLPGVKQWRSDACSGPQSDEDGVDQTAGLVQEIRA